MLIRAGLAILAVRVARRQVPQAPAARRHLPFARWPWCCFFVFPPTPLSVVLFGAAMGILWLGVIPLVNGLVIAGSSACVSLST